MRKWVKLRGRCRLSSRAFCAPTLWNGKFPSCTAWCSRALDKCPSTTHAQMYMQSVPIPAMYSLPRQAGKETPAPNSEERKTN